MRLAKVGIQTSLEPPPGRTISALPDAVGADHRCISDMTVLPTLMYDALTAMADSVGINSLFGSRNDLLQQSAHSELSEVDSVGVNSLLGS